MQMMFIMVQWNSVLVYMTQPDSFAHLIGYEHGLGPYVHIWKYDIAFSTLQCT